MHLKLLTTPRASPLDVLKRITVSSVRSSLFLSAYCTIAWAVPCHLRNLFGRDEWWMYYVNGLAAGTAVAIESKPRRLELAMYCAPRALESLWFTLVGKGYVKNIPCARLALPVSLLTIFLLGERSKGEVIYFSAAMGALMAIYHNEPDCLNGAFRGVMVPFFGAN